MLLQRRKAFVGEQAPVWVPSKDVSMCMLCAVEFNIARRKHHCRACGSVRTPTQVLTEHGIYLFDVILQVVCAKCSRHSLKLAFVEDRSRRDRVCDECFLMLTSQYKRPLTGKRHIARVRRASPVQRCSPQRLHCSHLFQMRARECCLCAGNMRRSTNSGKTWEKFWVELEESGTLQYYKAKLVGKL